MSSFTRGCSESRVYLGHAADAMDRSAGRLCFRDGSLAEGLRCGWFSCARKTGERVACAIKIAGQIYSGFGSARSIHVAT